MISTLLIKSLKLSGILDRIRKCKTFITKSQCKNCLNSWRHNFLHFLNRWYLELNLRHVGFSFDDGVVSLGTCRWWCWSCSLRWVCWSWRNRWCWIWTASFWCSPPWCCYSDLRTGTQRRTSSRPGEESCLTWRRWSWPAETPGQEAHVVKGVIGALGVNAIFIII